MTFDWDPAKSDRNLAQRGFDFEFATQLFATTYLEFDDTRRDYGERRVVSLGVADGIPLTVVFTDRVVADGAIVRRIISGPCQPPQGAPPLCRSHRASPFAA